MASGDKSGPGAIPTLLDSTPEPCGVATWRARAWCQPGLRGLMVQAGRASKLFPLVVWGLLEPHQVDRLYAGKLVRGTFMCGGLKMVAKSISWVN